MMAQMVTEWDHSAFSQKAYRRIAESTCSIGYVAQPKLAAERKHEDDSWSFRGTWVWVNGAVWAVTQDRYDTATEALRAAAHCFVAALDDEG
jgi:hypothetical protein